MPTPDITSNTIFYADPDQLSGDYSDGDEILSGWTEGSSHNYLLVASRALTGDYHMQKYRSGSVWTDTSQKAVEGFVEPQNCSSTERNAGFTNGSTDAELLLDGPFTIAFAVQPSAFVGCWQNGEGVSLITRRGKDAGLDFTGWEVIFFVDSFDDTKAFITFNSFGPSFNNLTALQSPTSLINIDTPYVIVVVSDGSTVRIRVNGTEIISDDYVFGSEPGGGSDLHFLCSGDGQNAPMGFFRYGRVYSRELTLCDLETLETALGDMVGATMAATTGACGGGPGFRDYCGSVNPDLA